MGWHFASPSPCCLFDILLCIIRFNADDQSFLLKEIEIQSVDDLNYVYDDEILLRQIRDHLSEQSYSIFLTAREKTEGLLQVLKRRKEERGKYIPLVIRSSWFVL